MTKFNITTKEYITYLEVLRSNIFKVLPLYEEENPHLKIYIKDTSDKLKMLKHFIFELESGFWYIESLICLEDIFMNLDSLEQKDVKRKVFNIVNLITNEIKEQSDAK